MEKQWKRKWNMKWETRVVWGFYREFVEGFAAS